jgi:hypothetical protein
MLVVIVISWLRLQSGATGAIYSRDRRPESNKIVANRAGAVHSATATKASG